MSVEEHLEYYARIKGIRKDRIKRLVDKEIKEMNLEDHRKKLAGALSGGNKRKLSVAICVIGNPPIILLDEPSAGMDPEARRFMWSVVAKISQ
jgi:ATP-binding cassette subfamily A (ABC1) protein 3